MCSCCLSDGECGVLEISFVLINEKATKCAQVIFVFCLEQAAKVHPHLHKKMINFVLIPEINISQGRNILS